MEKNILRIITLEDKALDIPYDNVDLFSLLGIRKDISLEVLSKKIYKLYYFEKGEIRLDINDMIADDRKKIINTIDNQNIISLTIFDEKGNMLIYHVILEDKEIDENYRNKYQKAFLNDDGTLTITFDSV